MQACAADSATPRTAPSCAKEGADTPIQGATQDAKGKHKKTAGQQGAVAVQCKMGEDRPSRQHAVPGLSGQGSLPNTSLGRGKEAAGGFKRASGSGGGISQKSGQNATVVQGLKAAAAESVSADVCEVVDEATKNLARPASTSKVKPKGKALHSTK